MVLLQRFPINEDGVTRGPFENGLHPTMRKVPALLLSSLVMLSGKVGWADNEQPWRAFDMDSRTYQLLTSRRPARDGTVNWEPYNDYVASKMDSRWVDIAQEPGKAIVLRFTAHCDGRASNVVVTKSAASSQETSRAIETVRRAVPLAPFPVLATEQQCEITLNVDRSREKALNHLAKLAWQVLAQGNKVRAPGDTRVFLHARQLPTKEEYLQELRGTKVLLLSAIAESEKLYGAEFPKTLRFLDYLAMVYGRLEDFEMEINIRRRLVKGYKNLENPTTTDLYDIEEHQQRLGQLLQARQDR